MPSNSKFQEDYDMMKNGKSGFKLASEINENTRK